MSLLSSFEITQELSSINQDSANGWVYNESSLKKLYVFKDFSSAISFIVQIAFIAEKVNHHPEISNIYNEVTLVLQSHDVGGITIRDISLAKKINSLFG